MSTLDALTLAVIQAGLQQVCNEMDIAFSRSAFSPVIAEADDRSDGIYDRDTGALISQGEYGLPVFVGTMQYSTGELIRLIREGRVGAPEPGDIYIVNDPYLGGTHLMDVRFVKPVFVEGALFCWLQNTGHWPDIGGMVRAASRPTRRRSSRRDCACRRSSCSSAARWTRRSSRSSRPTSASPTSASATSRHRPQP